MRIDQFLPVIEQTLGTLKYLAEPCPDVYCLSVRQAEYRGPIHIDEYYIVFKDAAVISAAAKSHGQMLPNVPELLFYPFEPPDSGWRIVDYEVNWYLYSSSPTKKHLQELQDAAAFGRRIHPDYFGMEPIPYATPFGNYLRCIPLDKGIFWIATDRLTHTLCVSYPVFDDLSDFAKALSAEAEKTSPNKMDSALGCLFFPQYAASVPLFELMQHRPQWQRSSLIDGAALMNVLFRDYPEYVVSHNLAIQNGAGDVVSLLLNAAGTEKKLAIDETQMIRLSPTDGTDYLRI